jgi:hypothetical protein
MGLPSGNHMWLARKFTNHIFSFHLHFHSEVHCCVWLQVGIKFKLTYHWGVATLYVATGTEICLKTSQQIPVMGGHPNAGMTSTHGFEHVGPHLTWRCVGLIKTPQYNYFVRTTINPTVNLASATNLAIPNCGPTLFARVRAPHHPINTPCEKSSINVMQIWDVRHVLDKTV